MSDIVQVIESEESFAAATQTGVVLVDFFATWCRPCRMQMPIVEQVAADFNGRAKVVKVDTDKVQALAVRFGIQSIPTLVILKDGKTAAQLVGLQQAENLKQALEQALA